MLANLPGCLGNNAANAAKQYNVGMEIDYEKSSSPNLTGLQKFVTAYRSVLPYDPTGNNQAARLTNAATGTRKSKKSLHQTKMRDVAHEREKGKDQQR